MRRFLLVLPALVAVSAPAADDDTFSPLVLEPITVTATRRAQQPEDIASLLYVDGLPQDQTFLPQLLPQSLRASRATSLRA